MTLLSARIATPRAVALLSGLAAIALGAGVLAGWALDIGMLKTVVPGLATMKVNTAAGTLLCGTALALLSRADPPGSLRAAGSAIALAVIALAGLTLAEDLFGWNFGLDQWLFSDTTGALEATSPGRMPPSTAFCLLLAGCGLFLAARRRQARLRIPVLYGLASAVVVIGGLGLIGHLSALMSGARWWDYAGMAIHSTVGFLLLGSGLLALARRDDGLQWSLNRLITFGFATGIVSLVAAAALSYSFTSELRRETASVTHSQQVITEFEGVKSHLAELESNQRGYIITGDERSLAGRNEIARALDEHLAIANELIADGSVQQQRMDLVASLIAQRKAFGDRTIEVRRKRGFAEAQQMIVSGVGIELSRHIGEILREMEAEEYVVLNQRFQRSAATATATFLLLPLGAFISLTILITGLFLLNSGAGEQVRTEEAMRASEARYRQLIEQASDGIFVLDAEGRFVLVNPPACELLGYQANELLGVDHSITYPENELHLRFERMRQARTGAVLRYERMVIRKDGTAFPAEFSSRMLASGDSQIILRDITERRRAETQLRESEGKFRQLIEQASDGIFISDAEGNFVLVNSRGCELLGYSESELLGLNGRVTYLDEEREIHARRMQEVSVGATLRFERMVRRKDGSAFPAEISVKRLDNGLVQVIFHDITERRRAAEALRESERRFSDLLGTVELVSMMLDRNARITYCNDYLLRLTGRQRDEVLGQDWFELFIPPGAGELRTTFADLLADLPQSWHHENEILTRSGERRLIRWNNSVLRSASGEVIGTASIGEDITESKRARETLAAERTLLRTLIDALPDVVFTKDASGRFTMCNAAGFRHSGFSREADIVGKAVFDLYPRELAEQYHADDARALRGEAILNREEAGLDAAGNPRWFLTIKIPLRDTAGDIVGIVGISRDITQRKEHENKIARLNRIQAMLSGINSAIVRIRDRDELFKEACRIATEHGAFPIVLIGMAGSDSQLEPVAWSGEGAAEIAKLARTSRKSASGVAMRAFTERRTAIENDIGSNPEIDPVRRAAVAHGCRSAIALPLFRDKEIVGMFLLYGSEKNAFDEEEVKLLEELAGDVSFALTFIAQQEKVNYLAYYDTLTGLPNRTLFFDRLGRQLAAANRENSGVSLLLMDLDRFRIINDTLGRQAGDALLKEVADRIKASVREQDTVARISADRFAISASGVGRAPDLAHIVESRKRDLFSLPFYIGGEELRVSATAGIAVFPEDAELPETLVANAEAALRSAKQQNVPLLFCGPEMNAQAAQSLRMESRLRRALERQELALWYQPKIDAESGKLTGFEALMRWIDPELGIIPPGRFIPLMEQTGLIFEAGNWALSQVARDCAGWLDNANVVPRVAVNVSPLQLRGKDFVAKVIDAADGIERSGGCLDLEITESVIMENVDAIIPKLQTVRGLGVHIYIDDFGTGYSSLAYIARLPIYSLKIDRSFVVGMTQNEESRNIVKSVISLAHSLKLRVVAEGVETEEQAGLLKGLDCDEFQGYLFGRPVPPNEVPALMKRFG